MKSSAVTMKMPAAAPTIAPRISWLTFSETSALASSISSRISSDARSEISWTAAPMLCCSGSAAKAPDQDRENDAPGERRPDQHLGAIGQRARGLAAGGGLVG